MHCGITCFLICWYDYTNYQREDTDIPCVFSVNLFRFTDFFFSRNIIFIYFGLFIYSIWSFYRIHTVAVTVSRHHVMSFLDNDNLILICQIKRISKYSQEHHTYKSMAGELIFQGDLYSFPRAARFPSIFGGWMARWCHNSWTCPCCPMELWMV